MVLSLQHYLVLVACGSNISMSQVGGKSSMRARLRFWNFLYPAERRRLFDNFEFVPPGDSKSKNSSQVDAAVSLLLLLRPALYPDDDSSTEPCGPCDHLYNRQRRRNTNSDRKDSATLMDMEDWSEAAFSTMGMIWGSGAMTDDWIEHVNEMTSL